MGMRPPNRSDDPPPTMRELEKISADATVSQLEGRLRVLEGIDLAEGRTDPSPATLSARRDLQNVRSARMALEAPLRPVVDGRPRRAIDDAKWVGNKIVEPQSDPLNRTFHIPAPKITVEIAPGPTWLKPTTYVEILKRLRAKITPTGALQPGATIDRVDRWAARHITLVEHPRELVSDSSMGDRADTATLVRAALEIAAEAKRRGIDPTELGKPRRHKLFE